MARSLALLALASTAMAAQSTTVSLLLPFADPQKLDASVIAADSTATTYLYGCPPGSTEGCGFATSETIIQGPSTWIYQLSFDNGAGETNIQGGQCKLTTASDAASCTMYATVTDSAGSVSSMTSASVMTFLDFLLPVTVTAGLEKLKATPGATATDGSTSAPTTTGASETAQMTASTTVTKQTTGTGAASTTANPTSTNAAGLVNAQNGLFAGVAAIVGGAMML
ncbi:hypothetical protein V8C37DRAFT_386044 [Trichoderma ceciliae]